MTDSTCSSCGAAHRGGAWCTRCYAPIPGAQPVHAEPSSAGTDEPFEQGRAAGTAGGRHEPGRHSIATESTESAVAALVASGAVTLATAAAASVPETRNGRHRILQTWPCTRCGAETPIENDTCTDCGASFLGDLADGGVTVEVPILSSLTARSTAVRTAAALALSVVVVAIVTAVLLLLDAIF